MTVNIIFQRRGGTLLSSDFWYKIKFLLTPVESVKEQEKVKLTTLDH